jgi:hypothetical protein
MLGLELYQSIKNAVGKEGRSIRATAKEFKVHRREVRRHLPWLSSPERKTMIKMRPKRAPCDPPKLTLVLAHN